MNIVNVRFNTPGIQGRRIGFQAFGHLFCLEKSTVWLTNGDKYLTRWIIYCVGTLRLHKFWRGDDDRAPHTHPWAFWTFPLTSYLERVYCRGVYVRSQVVQRFHWRKRSAQHEHIVVIGVERVPDLLFGYVWRWVRRPFYTFVLTGPKSNEWGFYPEPENFIHWRDYK